MFIFFFHDGKDYAYIFVGKVNKCIDWSKIKLSSYTEIVLWYIPNSREIFIIEYDKYFNLLYRVQYVLDQNKISKIKKKRAQLKGIALDNPNSNNQTKSKAFKIR